MSGEYSTPRTDIDADFSAFDTWIFDLDNTLYRADCDLFAEIERRMTDYIVRHLGLAESEAHKLRKLYYRDHGSTLAGLITLNGVDPEHFLAYVHDIDLSVLKRDEVLAAALPRLPGRHYVFTNGCRHHARRVLERIGLTAMIDDIWDIRTIDYVPKPKPAAYEKIVAKAGFSPAAAVMFEDLAINLEPAYALGMTTVWLRNDSPWSHQEPGQAAVARRYIHHEIDDLGNFLQTIRL
jgi:putative hydrolase of the HAD superfamily